MRLLLAVQQKHTNIWKNSLFFLVLFAVPIGMGGFGWLITLIYEQLDQILVDPTMRVQDCEVLINKIAQVASAREEASAEAVGSHGW